MNCDLETSREKPCFVSLIVAAGEGTDDRHYNLQHLAHASALHRYSWLNLLTGQQHSPVKSCGARVFCARHISDGAKFIKAAR